jgi:hypothetical protein
MDYQLIVLLHLVGAILFVGAVALEVLVLEPVRKLMSEDVFRQVEFYLFRRIRRTYPLAIIPLFITGFYMYGHYIDLHGGHGALLATRFGVLLTVKMGLALGLLTIFASAPFLFMRPRDRGWLGQIRHFLWVSGEAEDFRIDRFELVHYVAFALGMSIVVLAKLMFIP